MKESLKRDVLNTVGSIYALNSPNAIGYLFNENKSGDEIICGMYCNRVDEIDPARWGWFYSKAGNFYNLDNTRSFNTLMNIFEKGGHVCKSLI